MKRFLIPLFAILMATPALSVDTQKTKSECETLLADNAAGAISPQDLRDCVVASLPYLDGTHTGILDTPAGTGTQLRMNQTATGDVGSAATPALAFCYDTATSDCDYGLFLDRSQADIDLTINGTVRVSFGSVSNIYSDLDPGSDNGYDLGGPTLRYSDVYTLNLKADDAGTAVTIPAIDNDASDIVIGDNLNLSAASAQVLLGYGGTACADAQFKASAASSGWLLDTNAMYYCYNNGKYFQILAGVTTVNPNATAAGDFIVETDTVTEALKLDAGTEEMFVGVSMTLTNHYVTAGDPGCAVAGDVGRIAMFDNASNQIRACVCEQTAAATYAWQDLGGGTTCSSF